MKKKLLFLFFTICNLIYGQEEKLTKFDSIFEASIKGSSGKNAEQILSVADSLYLVSNTEIQKIKSLMLSANVHSRLLNTTQSIQFAEKANTIAEKNNDYKWQSRIAGFLSNQYRVAGLLEQGKIYLKKGLIASQKLDSRHEALVFQGLVYSETSKYSLAESNPTQAIKDLEKSRSFYEQLKNEDHNYNYFIGSSYLETADIFLKLNNLGSAKNSYEKALSFISKDADAESDTKGYIYNGLGKVYQREGDMKNALENFNHALEIAEKIKNVQLQENVYLNLKGYYKDAKDIDNYDLYSEKYINIIKSKKNSTAKVADKAIKTAEEKNQKSDLFIRILEVFISILVIGSIGFYMYHRRKIKQFNLIVENNIKESKTKELVELATKDPQVFYKEFNTHFPAFHKKLLERSPELTLADIEMCCYIYFNFSTKEIATYTKNSIGAVEARKHRNRKKMEFSGDKDLILWMINEI